MLLAWRSADPTDLAGLIYSANYLIRSGRTRWALDPLTLPHRLQAADIPNLAQDLAGLDFVLLSHNHADHFDERVIRSLRGLPVRWILPEILLPLVESAGGLPQEWITIARPFDPIEIHGVRITPFNSLHWEPVITNTPDRLAASPRGVPELGYLIETNDKRWLFPGDIRHYDASGLPDFGRVDVLFAHVWLGRDAAALPHPPLLEDFCQFQLALRPQRIILTHLEEWGRGAADFWDVGHARLIQSRLHELAPHVRVEIALSGSYHIL